MGCGVSGESKGSSALPDLSLGRGARQGTPGGDRGAVCACPASPRAGRSGGAGAGTYKGEVAGAAHPTASYQPTLGKLWP